MHTARFGHGLPVRSVCAALALALSCLVPRPGHAADEGVQLLLGHTRGYDLKAHGSESFRITVPAGSAVDVRIQQRTNGMELVLPSRTTRSPTPRYCPSGTGCRLHLTLIGRARGRVHLRLLPLVPGRPASGSIDVSWPQHVTAADRLRVRGERLLARAEWAQRVGPAAAWPQAATDYRAAQQLAHRSADGWLLRSALTNEARLDLFQLGHYRAALALGRAAVRQPFGTDWADEALAWQTLSSACAYRGRNGEAIAAQRRALALDQRTGNRFEQDVTLGNLAYEQFEIGSTRAALRSARRSLQIARAIDDGPGVVFDLEALAEFHRARGDVNRAFRDFQRVFAALKHTPYPDRAAAAWDGLGELYDTLGERSEARRALRHALRLAVAAHDPDVLLDVRINLGSLMRQRGEAAAALAFDRRSLARAVALGLPREQSFLQLGLGRDEAALGHRRRARAAFRRALALATKMDQPDSEASACVALGDEQQRVGSVAAAREDYLRALGIAQRRFGPLTAVRAEGSLARLDAQQGRLAAARRRIDQAVKLLGAVRSTVTTEHLRTEYLASEHGYYDLGVSILMRLHRLHPGAGDARAALRMVERARARSLLDGLQGRHRLDAALLPVGLAHSLQHTATQLRVAYADWRALLADAHASSPRFAQLRRRIASLRRRSHALEVLARARSARYAAFAQGRPASLRSLQQVLGPHAALLEYWVGPRRGYAWLVRRQRITTLRLPGASQLDPLVQAFRSASIARSRSPAGESLEQRAARIGAADRRVAALEQVLGAGVLPSAHQLRGITTLYLVPDGPLFALPFAALRAAGATRALIDSTALVEEPSASVLVALGARRAADRAGSIVVFAAPVYRQQAPRGPRAVIDAPVPARALPGRLTWTPQALLAHLPSLPGSQREARAIARLSGGRAVVHSGFAATVGAVQHTDWHHVAIAHFAVHTLLDAQHPALSGLVLSLWHRNGSAARGVLWLHQIESLSMPVDLVVLSSCDTLSGRAVPGEGLVGLFRAFLLAGAHAVLGTLWRVRDRATARFMRIFYTELLRRHLPPAQALRAAQRAMSRLPRYAAPYYWAGFSLEGLGESVR